MTDRKEKILLVEDEKDTVASISHVLTRRGFEVASTGSGKEAIGLIQRAGPDLVLLDLSLEGLTGMEVLERLRQHDLALKVVIVTGSVLMADDREKLCALGVHGFLCKPCDPEQLLEAIDDALDSEAYLPLEAFPVWQYEAAWIWNNRHDLKGILGALNMQCANLLSDIEAGRLDGFDVRGKAGTILSQLKEIHGKVKKACEVVNQEILS